MKKIKLVVGALLFSFISTSSQAGLVGYALDHPVKTVRNGLFIAGVVSLALAERIAYLAAHPNEINPYLKQHPENYSPIAKQVLAKLNKPANKNEYNQYKRMAEIMGLTNIPPYAPPKINLPNTLINPPLPQDPKAQILVNPAHPEINLNPADPRTHYDFTKDIKPDVPTHTTTPIEEQHWQDYITEKTQAQILDENMRKAGYGKKYPGYAAHHIVAWNDNRYPVNQDLRDLLSNNGIDLNDAENGVYLPTRKYTKNSNEAYHPEVHTERYYKNVENRLSKYDGDKTGMQNELKKIGNELKNNQFKY